MFVSASLERLFIFSYFLSTLSFSIMSFHSTPILQPQSASISSTHYPPPVLVKHPIWYLDHADLFISVQGTLYGVHWAYFDDSSYFHAIMDILDPLFIIPQGYQPQQPIPFNNLDEMSLHWLISYLYKPMKFPNNRPAWKFEMDKCRMVHASNHCNGCTKINQHSISKHAAFSTHNVTTFHHTHSSLSTKNDVVISTQTSFN